MPLTPPLLTPADLARLAADRAWVGDGSALDAGQVAELAARWEPVVRPAEKEQERFDLVDARGEPTGVTAPRWLCHLMGLCHRTVHLALRTPQGLLALQVRGLHVRQHPGALDLAVTGHVRAGLTWDQALRQEAAEELGLDVDPQAGQVAPPGPQPVARYCRRETDRENPPEHVCHVTQLYAAQLTAHGLATLRFADGEVAGLYLCAPAEAARLVAEEPARVAPGLAQSLPYYLAHRGIGDGSPSAAAGVDRP
ncbi:MAG: NUDIX domain-containing protein [Caldilineales bacterium]|nr:NUDIX domain-containing protein [Caldilineales bacterium]